MALLVALILVIGDIGNAPNMLVTVAPAWWLPVTCVNFLQPVSVCILCCLFPDGRFVPRWIGWIVPIWIAWNVPIFFFPTAAFSPNSWSPTLQFLVFALFFGLFVYASPSASRFSSIISMTSTY